MLGLHNRGHFGVGDVEQYPINEVNNVYENRFQCNCAPYLVNARLSRTKCPLNAIHTAALSEDGKSSSDAIVTVLTGDSASPIDRS